MRTTRRMNAVGKPMRGRAATAGQKPTEKSVVPLTEAIRVAAKQTSVSPTIDATMVARTLSRREVSGAEGEAIFQE
jgi:hypothetical protein